MIEAYQMYVDTYTEDDFRTLSVKGQLATAISNIGFATDAINMQKSVCDKLVSLYGKDHSATIRAYINLSRIYVANKQHDLAIDLATQISEHTCKIFGEGDYLSLESMENLSLIYFNAQKSNESIEYWDKLYNLQCKYLGKKHINTLQSRSNYAVSYVMKGGKENLRLALEIFNEVLEAQTEVCGEYELVTMKTRYLIANCYSLGGNNELAIKHQKKVVDMMHERYRADHIHTMRYSYYLGCYYYFRCLEMKQSRYKYTKKEMLLLISLAEKNIRESYEIGCKVYGKNDPRNLQKSEDLKSILKEQKSIRG